MASGRQQGGVDPPHHFNGTSGSNDTSGIRLCGVAVGESSVIVLHPPLPLLAVSIGMERGVSEMTVSPTASWGADHFMTNVIVFSTSAHHGSEAVGVEVNATATSPIGGGAAT